MSLSKTPMLAQKASLHTFGTLHILLLIGTALCACVRTTHAPLEDSLTPAVVAGKPPPAGAAPASELPEAVETAKNQLLQFRELDALTLTKALSTLNAFDPPERYEEQGLAEGKPYYYEALTYRRVGLKVHSDGKRVTNVE